MQRTSLFGLFMCLYFSNCTFLNGHNKIMEQFRKTANPEDMLRVTEQWLELPIDHFHKCNTRTWRMRYFENMEKWKGGPVYIFIGGEGETAPSAVATGLLYELAEETKGAMFATEHRYYGKSMPFEEVTRKNIRYLTSKQALADLAYFIRKNVKNNAYLRDSKVVVVGGSYAGNLAVWMRLHYPKLVDAAIASSAPVLAKLDFEEFLETVGNVYEKYAEKKCFYVIEDTFKRYMNDLKSSIGINKLKKEQNICADSDLIKWENQAEFFDERIESLIVTTQHGTSSQINDYCYIPSTKYCKQPIGCCKLDFDKSYRKRKPHSLVSKEDFWTYQSCNEFGQFLSTPKSTLLQGIHLDVDYMVTVCSRLFGSKFNKEYIEGKIKATNDRNKGLNPKVTNVIFVHGEIDPWQRLGIVNDLSLKAPARVIQGASHCNDLFSNDACTSTIHVKLMKEQEKKYIKKWIGFKYQ